MTESTTAPPRLLKGLPWVFIGTTGYMLSLAGLTFALPRFLTPLEFGHWQLFQFYVLYLGYVTFGYSDGLLLRTAGRPWRDLPAAEIRRGMVFLLAAELLSFGLLLAVLYPVLPENNWVYLLAAAVGVLFFIPRVVLQFLFQATGRAPAVMVSMLVERLVLLGGFAVFCVAPTLGLNFLIASDVVGKVIGLAVSLGMARGLFHVRPAGWGISWRAFLVDCRSGMFVVLSNLMALALNGVVRLIIGTALGVVAFGQVSLALQVSTVLLVVINAVSVAVFPNLKSRPVEQWPPLFLRICRFVLPLGMAFLLIGEPLGALLRWWSPAYEQAVTLLVLLMPVGYFEVKSRGILAVFMKAARAERSLFTANFVSAVCGAAACAFAAFVLDDLDLAALSLVLALWVRTLLVEFITRRRLDLDGFSAGTALLEAACLAAYYWMVGPGDVIGYALFVALLAAFWAQLSRQRATPAALT